MGSLQFKAIKQLREKNEVMKAHRQISILTIALISVSLITLKTGRADDGYRDILSSTNGNGEVRRWEITGPWGGDVRSLVVSPDNSDLLYLGTSDGQIYRSIDGSRTWQRLKPGLGHRGLSIDYIIIDPRGTKTMYAGAWGVSFGNDAQGVYKSTDGGESWNLLKQTKGLSIFALAMAPSDSNFLISGAKTGVFRSRDGGESWERISPEGHPEIRNINSAAIDPHNTDIIFIGTNHLPWRTRDGGKSWTQTGYKAVGMIDDTDIMGICINPVNNKLVYMNGCSGIYRSVNGGEKWSKLPGIPFSARRTYALLPHPTLPNVIFAGTSEGLWRSKDGGKRWMLLTSKTVVIRSVVVHPEKPDRVLIATDDFGVRLSNNLGDDFADANTGFIHRHILAIMPDATERGRLLASVFHDGTASSVFASLDGGESWHPSSRGLGPRDVFTFYQMPDNPNTIYAGTNSGIYRSNDRGASWSFVSKKVEKPKKPVRKPRRSKRRAELIAPQKGFFLAQADYSTSTVRRYQTVAAQSRSKPRSKARKPAPKKKPAPVVAQPAGPVLVELTRQVDGITSFVDAEGRTGLFAATMDGLYRTYDETKGWEKIIIDGYEPSGRVFSVSTSKKSAGRILAGTRQGLFISDNGGASWMHIERGPDNATVKSIAQDPRNPDLIILGTNQFVYRSTNGGRTWDRRGGGLVAGDFTSVVINPANPDEVIVADYSRGGVYRSTDRGYVWERIDKELPSNRVWTLIFDPFDRDRIYAGSFSSGVYVLTIQKGATSSSQ
jgi:photosystem II stability/assembly factor-like uncharacterized protein